MHQAIKATNLIEEFRYRLEDNTLVCFDKIHIGTTMGRSDETFGFAYVPFNHDWETFSKDFKQTTLDVENSTGIRINENTTRLDLIHSTSLPWIDFSGFHHASNSNFPDSIPKISFGKYNQDVEGNYWLPLSVHVHHALMDGIHVGKWIEAFQRFMDGE
jgi:chloramphenicol O-acetyltransferase type A